MFLLAGQRFSVVPFFWDGELAVYVFFALSGYVLSVDHFRRGQRADAALQAVRRYPRLTIPILASCAIAVALQKMGLFFNAPAGTLVHSPWLESFYRFDLTWPGLVRFAGWDVYAQYDVQTTYNAVLWTMSYEMLGSLLIFGLLFVAGPSRMLQAALVLAFAGWAAWANSPLFAFAMGMAIAFWSASAMSRDSRATRWVGAVLLPAVLVAAMCRALGDSPIAFSTYAAGTLLAVQLLPRFQVALANRTSRWLGRLSFPLYLTHLLVICSLSSYLVIALADQGELPAGARTAIALATLGASVLAATLFAPVETAAVRWARGMSRLATAALRFRGPPPVAGGQG